MSADTTMGGPYRDWVKLEPMSNARLRQPSLAETSKLPVPAHIPGQLHLFIEPKDYSGQVGRVLQAMCGDFVTWRPDRGA